MELEKKEEVFWDEGTQVPTWTMPLDTTHGYLHINEFANLLRTEGARILYVHTDHANELKELRHLIDVLHIAKESKLHSAIHYSNKEGPGGWHEDTLFVYENGIPQALVTMGIDESKHYERHVTMQMREDYRFRDRFLLTAADKGDISGRIIKPEIRLIQSPKVPLPAQM